MPNTYACKLVSNPNVPIFLPRVCTLVLFIIHGTLLWSYIIICAFNYLIGAILSEPHTYCTAVQNLPYIYIYVSFIRLYDNLFPRRAPLNAQHANVGPASKGSKVNKIALKTATLVLRFS